MNDWYIIYPDQEVEHYDLKEDWENEIKFLSHLYNIEVIGCTAYVEGFDLEEVDWED